MKATQFKPGDKVNVLPSPATAAKFSGCGEIVSVNPADTFNSCLVRFNSGDTCIISARRIELLGL